VDTASTREASVQDFIGFLRSSGITEPQIPTFQKIAQQLLLGTGAADLLAVSTDESNRWREALRARNLNDSQMALISRGISAVHAFQRKKSAPPVAGAGAPAPGPASVASPVASPPSPHQPTPPSGQPTPPRRPPAPTGARKWGPIAGLAVIVIGSVVYTVVASQKAVQESRDDGKILSHRIAKKKIGVFYPAYTFNRQPSVGCEAGALAQVNRAVDMATTGGFSGAVGLLEDALAKDPSCVPAARVLTILESQMGGPQGVERLKDRFLPRADENPHDAPAQLMAAYCVRQLGDGASYRKYLERAEAADPRQPLLGNAWGSYWDLFAQPRDFAKELAADRQEVDRSGDLGTMTNLAAIYLEVGDYEQVKKMCDRYFAAVPDDHDLGHATVCLEAAISRQDAAGESAFLKRYWAAGSGNVGEACKHSDLAGIYLKYSCKFDQAIEEAQTAIQKDCVVQGAGHRRHALLGLHRYEEAAEPPPQGQYWEGVWGETKTQEVAYPDRDNRAQALGMTGRDEEALTILGPITERDERARILNAMIQEGVLRQTVEASSGCALPTERSEQLGAAAAGYISYKLLDDARLLIDQALALNPKSPRAWAAKIYMLSIDDKLDDAAQQGEAALALGVDDPYLAGNLGYVYQRQGKCDKAIPLFRRKLAGQPWTVPNYTNLAKCLEATGQTKEAALMWGYVQGGRPRTFWWMYVGLVVVAVGGYLGGKLALIKLLPARFGHLKLP
jgi:tetratricopeptide (TPR) repeat protein